TELSLTLVAALATLRRIRRGHSARRRTSSSRASAGFGGTAPGDGPAAGPDLDAAPARRGLASTLADTDGGGGGVTGGGSRAERGGPVSRGTGAIGTPPEGTGDAAVGTGSRGACTAGRTTG